jgi:DNA-binding SARP family transcriptional activator
MWFGLLGSLCVRDGDVMVPVVAGKQRAVLAVLLVRAGQVVSAGELAETVWDGVPPASAQPTLRNYVKRLRRLLGSAGSRIVTWAPGYRIDAGDDEIDIRRFARLCREGAAATRSGRWQRADATLGEALSLWRGAPLGDVPSEALRQEQVPVLEALRLQAVEWRADAGLALGRHAELAPDLQALCAAHPLRERLWAQLMLALYRCGRQAEALGVYQQARRALVGELGVEPGHGLQDIHRRILGADPALLSAPPGHVRLAPFQPAADGDAERTGRAIHLR